MALEPKKQPRGTGRVAFLAHADTFQKMIEDGYPVRAIYDEYSDRLGFGYPWFTKYVNKYLRKGKQDGHQKETQGQAKATNTTTAGRSAPAKPKKPVPFAHDPASGNTRDDLI